jgi:hypothetical protein
MIRQSLAVAAGCKCSARSLVRTVGVAAESTVTVGVTAVGASAKASSRITVAILLTPWMLELAAISISAVTLSIEFAKCHVGAVVKNR